MDGQGITPRHSYFDQFTPDDINYYLDYLRELESQGPAGLSQDRRFVPGPDEEQQYGIPEVRFGDVEPTEAVSRIPEPTGLGLVRGIRRGVEQLQATGYGALGLLGSGLSIDDLTKWGFEGYLRNLKEAAQYPKEVDFLDIRSLYEGY